MTATVVIVFSIVYLGMILGGLPFFQLECTGVALLGVLILVTGSLSAVFSNDIICLAMAPVCSRWRARWRGIC